MIISRNNLYKKKFF